MTKKVLILAEGPTEEAFIKQVLAPALPGLWLIPTIVKTKVTGAKAEKGGSRKHHLRTPPHAARVFPQPGLGQGF